MTSLLMVPLVILLIQLQPKKKTTTQMVVLIALCTSLLFHFQVAFAIVCVPLVLIVLALKRVKFSFSQISLGLIAFFSTLVPSFLFELKNNFLQTKAVVAFIQNFGSAAATIEPNATGVARVIEIGKDMIANAGASFFPVHTPWWLGIPVIYLVYRHLSQRENRSEMLVVVPLLLGSFLFYLVLPAKTYYLVALLPVWIIAAGSYISKRSVVVPLVLTSAFLVLACVHTLRERATYENLAHTTTQLYAPKYTAVQTAYELAAATPFCFVSFLCHRCTITHINFLYLNEIRKGKPAPTEFSYAPGEELYNPYKQLAIQDTKPEYTMLIVEDYIYPDVFEQWWQRVGSAYTIVEEKPISEALVVYKASRK
ncbi:MAG: hypothetical protein UZ22_OP11002000798 [Microgenomates bacterium OLB23]|nr:MAG: hypothetical protein UZ22_OP11002000798 [Microgenomates bacterium OLB23]